MVMEIITSMFSSGIMWVLKNFKVITGEKYWNVGHMTTENISPTTRINLLKNRNPPGHFQKPNDTGLHRIYSPEIAYREQSLSK